MKGCQEQGTGCRSGDDGVEKQGLKRQNEELIRKMGKIEEQIKIKRNLYNEIRLKNNQLVDENIVYKEIVQSYKQAVHLQAEDTLTQPQREKYIQLLMKSIENENMYKESIQNLKQQKIELIDIYNQELALCASKNHELEKELLSYKYHCQEIQRKNQMFQQTISSISQELFQSPTAPQTTIISCIRDLKATRINLQILMSQKQQVTAMLRKNIKECIDNN